MNKLKAAILESATNSPQRTKTGTVNQSFLFRDDFLGFSGHFPGYPILPAFVQLMAALSVMENIEKHEFILETVEKSKFQMEIRPNMPVEVTCRERTLNGKPAIEGSIIAEGKMAASFFFTYKR